MAKELAALPEGSLPFSAAEIKITVNTRGTIVEIPLNDLGYTHGPTTFYLSTKGYGVLINTARYTTFYFGTTTKLNDGSRPSVTIDIPGAKGIDLFIFDGPDMKTAMQRYNLFSGGGALPAIWGLGVKYRVKADFSQSQVDAMATYFRDHHIPCDVLGLEPKWQTAAYSCSYVWNRSLFPTPGSFIDSMAKMGFHLNLWEHAFTSPQSPLFDALKTKAGDYKVWGGLVPDFADPAARKIFADYHQREFADSGIAGFKLDECDNSNLAEGSSTWSFPELSTFPSGISGDQMHQLFGLLYQKTIYGIYKRLNRRTYLDVRASNDFASSYPAALYSDTYDHREYIRMIVNSGFAGMLWSPEVRESASIADLIRRTQTAVLSAQTLFNSWYLQNPPWLQIDKEKNNRNEFMDSAKIAETTIRNLLDLRMSLVPYLYSAFAEYHFKGIPPFRALVMDEPGDKNTFTISDEYLIGDNLLAAPLMAGQTQRSIYLPLGTWYDFNTNQKFRGGMTYTIQPALDQIPVFVKAGTILPLAKPLEHLSANSTFDITCYVYGDQPARASLFEDDGYTFDYEKGRYNTVDLSWKDHKGSVTRKGDYKGTLYNITGWKLVQ